MKTENAKDLQGKIAKETLALLSILGTGVETKPYEDAIRAIGQTWGVPEEHADELIKQIARERDGEQETPESELPINATGTETLEKVWGLFETSVKASDPNTREVLYSVALELAQSQNLDDWIKKTVSERQTMSASSKHECTARA